MQISPKIVVAEFTCVRKDIKDITVGFARILIVIILRKIVPIRSLLIMEHHQMFVTLLRLEASSQVRLEILVKGYILLMIKLLHNKFLAVEQAKEMPSPLSINAGFLKIWQRTKSHIMENGRT